MNDRAPIEQLARLVGIGAHYSDAFGRSHKVSDVTLPVLIGAFGLPADLAVANRERVERQRCAPLREIAWRRRLDLHPAPDATEANERGYRRDRLLLLDALVSEELIAPERIRQFLSASGEPGYSTELGHAILSYLARSRARLVLIQLEDVIAEGEQANLPGTTDAHPNWRRRMSGSLEELISGTDLPRIAALIEGGRLRSAGG